MLEGVFETARIHLGVREARLLGGFLVRVILEVAGQHPDCIGIRHVALGGGRFVATFDHRTQFLDTGSECLEFREERAIGFIGADPVAKFTDARGQFVGHARDALLKGSECIFLALDHGLQIDDGLSLAIHGVLQGSHELFQFLHVHYNLRLQASIFNAQCKLYTLLATVVHTLIHGLPSMSDVRRPRGLPQCTSRIVRGRSLGPL